MHHHATTNLDLGPQWEAWRSGHPESNLRDDARVLGVSEVELVATGCGAGVTRLCGGWVELLRGLQELGPVSVQTESNGSLIEAQGVLVAGSWSGRRGMLRIGASRIRVQLDQWYFGFAVRGAEDTASLQFFGSDGQRILTVTRRPETMRERWTQLVRRFTSADQNPWVDPAPTLSPHAVSAPDGTVDVKALRRAWDEQERPQDWGDVLLRLGISRGQAVRLVGPSRARLVPTATFKVALRCAANAHVPVSVTVESPGAAHQYTGLVRRVESVDGLLMVVEPGLRLYISEGRIATAWIARRASEQGVLSSLEYFDAFDQPILAMAGNTIPGEPGLDRWERLVASL